MSIKYDIIQYKLDQKEIADVLTSKAIEIAYKRFRHIKSRVFKEIRDLCIGSDWIDMVTPDFNNASDNTLITPSHKGKMLDLLRKLTSIHSDLNNCAFRCLQKPSMARRDE